MNVVTDVRTTQRTCKRTSGRTPTYEWTDTCAYEWTDVCTYVRWHVHSSRARARTEIRSTLGLISVRLNLPNTKYVRKNRDVRKADSSRPYFRTCARTWRVNVTHVRTLTRPSTWHVRPLVRHASVHSYAYTYAGSYARPSPRSSALVTRRTLSKITTFYETLKKAKLYNYILKYIHSLMVYCAK